MFNQLKFYFKIIKIFNLPIKLLFFIETKVKIVRGKLAKGKLTEGGLYREKIRKGKKTSQSFSNKRNIVLYIWKSNKIKLVISILNFDIDTAYSLWLIYWTQY